MKKIVSLFATLLFAFCAFSHEAQEVVDKNDWTDQTKIYWLISIAALSIFLVIRTFRNKPEA